MRSIDCPEARAVKFIVKYVAYGTVFWVLFTSTASTVAVAISNLHTMYISICMDAARLDAVTGLRHGLLHATGAQCIHGWAFNKFRRNAPTRGDM